MFDGAGEDTLYCDVIGREWRGGSRMANLDKACSDRQDGLSVDVKDSNFRLGGGPHNVFDGFGEDEKGPLKFLRSLLPRKWYLPILLRAFDQTRYAASEMV